MARVRTENLSHDMLKRKKKEEEEEKSLILNHFLGIIKIISN